MKLKTKMILSMSIVFILFTLASGIGLMSMNQSQIRFERFLERDVALLQSESNMYAQGLQMGQALRNIILEPTNKTAFKNYEMASKDFNEELQRGIALSAFDPEAQKTLEAISELRKKQQPIQANIIAIAKVDRTEAIEAVNKGETPLWREIKAKLLDLIKKRADTVDASKAATLESTNQNMILSFGFIVVAILFGAGLSAWLVRSITRPLEYAVKIAKTAAGGDLSSQIEVKTHDETGELLQALKDMNDSLHKTVSEVRSGTETIASASREITAGNRDLSSRTEAQASSLEKTASSMDKLTTTVRQNAENAREANQLAETASEVAMKGGAVVSEVVHTMGAISDASRKIYDIISVIDGIAFQTNILALNAAVEAARAGEQGRGFAVVASEVRTLAQSSASAAREIKNLINNSVEKVDIGNKLVEQAGNTMTEVVASIKRVNDIMTEITTASHEQSSGIEQVNHAITEMDIATQQNASLVQEVTTTAASLQERGAYLANLVSTFKLEADGHNPESKQPKPTAKPFTKTAVKVAASQVASGDATQKPADPNDEWDEF